MLSFRFRDSRLCTFLKGAIRNVDCRVLQPAKPQTRVLLANINDSQGNSNVTDTPSQYYENEHHNA